MMEWIGTIFSAELLRNAVTAVLIAVLGVLGTRVIAAVLRRSLEKSRLEKAAYSLILSLTKVVCYLLVGLTAASALGIDVTGIVAMASVLTLAFSLALQNMVSNVIGGFTILSTHPFRSGDYVEIAGQAGTVREINMTYTMLTTPDNRLVSIPNSAVVAAQIVNYSAMETRRVDVAVSASYDVSTQTVLDALLQAGQVDKVLSDPAPMAAVTGYAESSVQYSLRMWVNNADYWDVYFEVNRRVRAIFDREGIQNPYPHLNVHVEK